MSEKCNHGVLKINVCTKCLREKHSPAEHGEAKKWEHPKNLMEFEQVYREEYEQELASCDRWIQWCKKHNDTHGINYHEGLRSAHVFNNIKMCQLLRILKKEFPNA